MIATFSFEFAVGLLCIIATLFLGQAGMAVFALYALLPLVARKFRPAGPDERELQLFYRTGNITMALIVVAILCIYFASGININGNLVGEHWHFLSIASVLFLHGLSGLLVFRRVE